MRRRRNVRKRVGHSIAYEKTTLEGVIIYIDPTDGWCNVELANGDILYRLNFSQGVHPRLKRLEQAVALIQTVGSRYKYVISGGARRMVVSTEFASKGTFKWNDGWKWNDGHIWG